MWCLGGDIDDFDRFPCVAYKNDKTAEFTKVS